MPGTLAERLRRARPATVTSVALAADGGPPDAPRRRRRRRILAAVAALIAAAVAVAIVALETGSSGPPSSGAAVPAGDTTATVERRTLVEHTQVNGTLGYGTEQELYDRVAGTFTWLPAVGTVIARGGTLWRLNNQPVVLMYGSVPAYRALEQGASDGPDVAELNDNLIALGFDPYGAIGDRSHFGEATAAAVRRWQAANGLSQTGKVELGRVLFAPSARRVTAVHVSLGQDPPGAAESGSSAAPNSRSAASSNKSGSSPPSQHKPSRVHSKTPSSHRPSSHNHPATHAHKNESGTHSPGAQGSSAEGSAKQNQRNQDSANKGSGNEGSANSGNGANGSANKNNGNEGGAPELVLGTTSTQQVVQLQVKANQQQLARVGEKAPVTLPDGRTVAGTITGVGTVATEASEGEHGNGHGSENGSGNGENATIPVTLSLDRAVARLDKAPVSVQLVKAISRNVLTVPAAALIAAGGGYAIQALESGRRTALTVTPGMFANGYVQVEGAGVREGLTVLEPR
jgi:peptidoglycan hydrolase-like protein with peptidoglycan-binding domain